MAGAGRLRREQAEVQAGDLGELFRDLHVRDDNMLHWTGTVTPERAPYHKGAFHVQIVFPAEYPFKPPKVTFLTKIYHPNVNEQGEVCLPIIDPENWKPATKTIQVIQALVSLVHEPEPEHPLRADLAEEYIKSRDVFMKNAEEFTQKYAEKR